MQNRYWKLRRQPGGGQCQQSPTESSRAQRPVSEESPLAETWRRTGTTGPGVALAGRGFDQTNLATEEDGCFDT